MAEPTLPEQVTKLYDLISGYHATHLLEIGRELGVWESITAQPGVTSDALAAGLRTDPFYMDVLARTATEAARNRGHSVTLRSRQ